MQSLVSRAPVVALAIPIADAEGPIGDVGVVDHDAWFWEEGFEKLFADSERGAFAGVLRAGNVHSGVCIDGVGRRCCGAFMKVWRSVPDFPAGWVNPSRSTVRQVAIGNWRSGSWQLSDKVPDSGGLTLAGVFDPDREIAVGGSGSTAGRIQRASALSACEGLFDSFRQLAGAIFLH